MKSTLRNAGLAAAVTAGLLGSGCENAEERATKLEQHTEDCARELKDLTDLKAWTPEQIRDFGSGEYTRLLGEYGNFDESTRQAKFTKRVRDAERTYADECRDINKKGLR